MLREGWQGLTSDRGVVQRRGFTAHRNVELLEQFVGKAGSPDEPAQPPWTELVQAAILEDEQRFMMSGL